MKIADHHLFSFILLLFRCSTVVQNNPACKYVYLHQELICYKCNFVSALYKIIFVSIICLNLCFVNNISFSVMIDYCSCSM